MSDENVVEINDRPLWMDNQEKYAELLAMTREAVGYLVSLNGDLNYACISNLVEQFEKFDVTA